jgi:FkbM family methyltransferase
MDTAHPLSEGIVATCMGVRVPAAPHLGPGMIAAMAEGRYERMEVQLALRHVPPGSRILELGAGSGVAGAAVALNTRPAAMLSVEANPNLLPHIRTLYAENGLDRTIALRHGVVASAPDAPATMEFHLRGNFLGSSLTAPADGRFTTITVPVIPYAALKRDFPHDVLLMDIEGAERDVLRHADLSGVTLLIAEFHRGIFGREGMRECRACLTAQGFVQDAEASGGGVHVWRRPA